jgi:hypothetical protein
MEPPRNPPRCAAWLLSHFLSGHHSDAIIGDLHEKYARGESAFWYWRQAFAALAAGLVSDMRQERLLALRGVLAGFAVMVPLYYGALETHRTANAWVEPYARESFPVFAFYYLYQVPLLLAWVAAAVISGWFATRCARTNLTGVATLTAVLQIPLAVWWIWPVWLTANGNPWYGFQIRVMVLVSLVGIPLGTLLGGSLASKKRRPA